MKKTKLKPVSHPNWDADFTEIVNIIRQRDDLTRTQKITLLKNAVGVSREQTEKLFTGKAYL